METASVRAFSPVSSSASLRSRVWSLSRRVSAGQYELVRLIAELDYSGEWLLDGAATSAHWVADACDIEVCTAREWLRIGQALHRLPITNAAAHDGALSFSKLRQLTRVATVDNETELVTIAKRVPAGRLAAALAAWLNRNEDPAATERRHHAARGLTWRERPDGMVAAHIVLPPAEAGKLAAAIDGEVMRTPTKPAEMHADPATDHEMATQRGQDTRPRARPSHRA